jgi:hypothetical protein
MGDGGWGMGDCGTTTSSWLLSRRCWTGKAPSGTSAQPEAPAELSLEDVVAAGRAAFCWLDVVVSLRNAERHQASVTGASTIHEGDH